MAESKEDGNMILLILLYPLSPLSTTAGHTPVPSTAAESGTTAIVTLNQSLVLTACFLLSFRIWGMVVHSVSSNTFVRLGGIGGYTIKNTKEVRIEVQVWSYSGTRMQPHCTT